MGHHRTPEELLAQALEKVNNLKLKVAQKQISNDPRMKSLLTDEKELKKELSKAMKWLDPEKGLTSRIAKLNAQIKEAEGNLANAEEIQKEESHVRKELSYGKKSGKFVQLQGGYWALAVRDIEQTAVQIYQEEMEGEI